MKYKLKMILIIASIVTTAFFNELSSEVIVTNGENIAQVHTVLKIDTVNNGENIPGNDHPYGGPNSLDIGVNGEMYLQSSAGYIQKYNKKGKRLWSIKLEKTVMDIVLYKNDLYSFNGRQVFKHDINNGAIKDTFNISIKNEDYFPIGNVSRFYYRYLLINKGFDKEHIYAFDLEKKEVSKRIPKGTNIYPITDCKACSFDLLYELFAPYNDLAFVSQSDKYLVYRNLESSKSLETIYIFNKTNGDLEKIDLSFFELIGTSAIRYATIHKEKYIIIPDLIKKKDTIWWDKIIFYKFKISI